MMLALLQQAVASLETISTMESFLGLASVLLRICRLVMHNKLPGVPVSCNSSISMGSVLTGFVHVVWHDLKCCWVSPGDKGKCPSLRKQLCFMEVD
jgi:hypothetical protein